MSIIPMLIQEMDHEAQTTRKMLSRVPNDRYDWRPHEKSMTVQNLATHIAELPSWVSMVLTTSELDFATSPYEPKNIRDTKDLLNYMEENLQNGRSELEKATEGQLEESWTLRNGETVYNTSSKAEVIRMAYCQIVHHRAQLGVYLRLLNIPIPGSYGPSADDPSF